MKLNKKGFTLVELLAVIVILVVIVAIAIPTISSTLERQKEKKVSAEQELLTSAAELYLTSNSAKLNYRTGSVCSVYIKDLIDNNYITEKNISNIQGNCFVYDENGNFTQSECTATSCTGGTLSKNALLSSLQIEGATLSPKFNSSTFSYSLTSDLVLGTGATKMDVSVKTTKSNSKAKVEITGNTSLEVGKHTISVKVTAEDTTVTKTYTIKVNIVEQKSIAKIPTASYCKTGLVYTGNAQTLTKEAGSGYTFSKNMGTNAGDYTVEAALSEGYKWSDDTIGVKTISCSINKATATITLSPESGEALVDETITFKEKANVAGSFSNVIADRKIAVVSQSSDGNIAANIENEVTATGVSAGESTITVTFTPDEENNKNYKEVTKTYTIIIKNSDGQYIVDDFRYKIISESKRTVKITGFVYGTDTSLYRYLEIPKTVFIGGKKYTVTEIGNFAFWHDEVITVKIPNSVTTIGDHAFYGNDLYTITIPDSVTTIGDSAFESNDLHTITIPDSVTTIGDSAFAFNYLYTITIPNSVTTIGQSAFKSNNLAGELSIPSSVTEIGDSAFRYNDLYTITIPDSVTTIGDLAFSYNDLHEVIFEDNSNLTMIGYLAFWRNNLTNIKIPNSVITIGAGAFNSNQLQNDQAFIYARNSDGTEDKTKIVSYGGVEKSVVIPEEVTEIGDFAFYDNLIESVTIPSSVITIGAGAFNSNFLQDDQALIYARNSDGTEDKTKLVSYGGRSLSATIPDSVKVIGEYAFAFNSLRSVTIPDSVTTIGDYAFYYNGLTGVTIPNSITTIGNFVFANNDLRDLEIPNSVTTIGDYAFYYNRNLESVTIPDSVTEIGEYAFAYLSTYNRVEIPNSVISIGEYAFFHSSISHLIIGESVTEIGDYAFAYNTLGVVIIPSSVTTIGKGVFDTSRVYNIYNCTGNAFDWGIIINGYSLNNKYNFVSGTVENGELDVKVLYYTDIFEYEIISESDKTVKIRGFKDDAPLYRDGKLDTIVYPSSLYQEIPETMIIEGTKYTVTEIGDYAFYADALTSIKIPNSVTTIGRAAFANNKLTSVTIPSSVTTIGQRAFHHNNLTTVTIPSSVTTIGDYAFDNNDLSSVTIGNSVESIGSFAFSNNNLKSVEIPSSVTEIGNDAFYRNDLSYVILAGNLTSIGYGAFDKYKDHSNENLNVIYNYLENILNKSNFGFTKGGERSEGIINLESSTNKSVLLVTADSYNYNDEDYKIIGIKENYKKYIESINHLLLPPFNSSVKIIGQYAFSDSTSSNRKTWTSLEIPYGIEEIEQGAFSYGKLKSISLPSSLTKIYAEAFKNNEISNLNLGSVVNIGQESFRDNNLSNLVIPDSVTWIGEKAFYNNYNLSSVSFARAEGNKNKLHYGDAILGVSGTDNRFENFNIDGVDSRWSNDLLISQSDSKKGFENFVYKSLQIEEVPSNCRLWSAPMNGTNPYGIYGFACP